MTPFDVEVLDFKGEQPDFIAKIDGENIGIELTIACHPPIFKHPALAIEAERSKYILALKGAVTEETGVIISVSCNDGIAVTKEDFQNIQIVADFLVQSANKLSNPDAVTYWNSNYQHPVEHDLEYTFPHFIQNICLYKDGIHDTKIGSSSGGVVPDFDDDVINPILAEKNRKLEKYRKCDEHWLVIVSNLMRITDHNKKSDSSNFNVSSFATCFGDVKVSKPINSNFDKCFLFK